MEALVQAIRNSEVFGRGTCSVIDEAYEDGEIVEALEREGIATEADALGWAGDIHAIWVDGMEDAINSAF